MKNSIIIIAIAFGAYGCTNRSSDCWKFDHVEFSSDGTFVRDSLFSNCGDIHVTRVKSFYPSGKLKSVGNFYDNKLHGPFILYFEDGTIADSTQYMHGKKQ